MTVVLQTGNEAAQQARNIYRSSKRASEAENENLSVRGHLGVLWQINSTSTRQARRIAEAMD